MLSLNTALAALDGKTSALRDLHHKLLKEQEYDKLIPPYPTREPLSVRFSFYLRGINFLDDVEEKLTTTAQLQIVWIDEMLTWNPVNYSDIIYFYLPQSYVWKPDITLHNGFTRIQELGNDVILVRIFSNGRIIWTPYEVFETRCVIDVTNFPFDTQICKLVFGVWATQQQDIFFDITTDEVLLDYFEKNGIWELIRTRIERTTATITVSLHMERRPQYFWLTILCPIFFLSVLSVFTFVIPVDSGEKMSYSMTVYLAFAVYFTIVSSSLPQNSQTTSHLSVYLIMVLIQGTLIVMVTAIQVRLHQRSSHVPVPRYVQHFIKLCKQMQAKRCRCRSKPTPIKPDSYTAADTELTIAHKPTQEAEEEESDIKSKQHAYSTASCVENDAMFTWTDFSSALDVFCFWTLSVLTLTLVGVYL